MPDPIHTSGETIGLPIVAQTAAGNVSFRVAANGDVTVGYAAGKVGFFGVAPVVQPAKPTDAATIIAAGVLLGLWPAA